MAGEPTQLAAAVHRLTSDEKDALGLVLRPSPDEVPIGATRCWAGAAGPSLGRPRLPEGTRRRPTVTVEPQPPAVNPQVTAPRPNGLTPKGGPQARWGVSYHVRLTHRQATSAGDPLSNVHLRKGNYRTKYHTDADCPSLNGKQETSMGQESMSTEEAKERGLTACQHCKR